MTATEDDNAVVVMNTSGFQGVAALCVAEEHGIPYSLSDREIRERMIYVSHETSSFVFPVSEVHGIHHFADEQLQTIPLTVARSKQSFTSRILPWREHHVGVLDHELLFYALENGLK